MYCCREQNYSPYGPPPPQRYVNYHEEPRGQRRQRHLMEWRDPYDRQPYGYYRNAPHPNTDFYDENESPWDDRNGRVIDQGDEQLIHNRILDITSIMNQPKLL